MKNERKHQKHNKKLEEKTENMRLNSVNSYIFLFCIYKMYLISAEG